MFGDRARLILRYGGFVGSAIHCFPSLSRTMELADRQIRLNEEKGISIGSGTIYLAERLTGARGRFTRQWYAPEGGLWGSMIYVDTLLPSSRLLLPLVFGVACCETLRQAGAESAVVRWINDVLVDGNKIAGFLLESVFGSRSREACILAGFGVNVNNREFPRELQQGAVSLADILGRPVDMKTFTCCFLAKLAWNLGLLLYEEDHYLKEEQWSGRQGRHALLERWCDLSDSIGRRVLFGFDVVKEPQFKARVLDVTGSGGLVLELDDGSRLTEYSGEIRYCSE